jgi:hypothetical protein
VNGNNKLYLYYPFITVHDVLYGNIDNWDYAYETTKYTLSEYAHVELNIDKIRGSSEEE